MIVSAFGFDYGIKSSNVTAQARENLYLDVKTEKDKTTIALYGTPGLNLFNGANAGGNPSRGVTEQIGDNYYTVKAGTFYKVNNAGVETAATGSLNTTSGNVSMAYNGTQIMIVDGTNGYIYTLATNAVVQISDGNFPNGATTVAFQGGFFLVDDPAHNGRFYKSKSYDGTTWAAADFATAEASPDALIRVYVNQGIVHLLGDQTTEFWSLTGALDFPYQPIQGAAIEWGIAARWSVAKLMGATTFLAKNLAGRVEVVMLNGLQPQPISSPELEAAFDTYSVGDAVAFSYMLNGHQFYQISFPSTGKTWLYDATMSQTAGSPIWSQLFSNAGRHFAQFYVNYINQDIVTDYRNGNAYKMLATTYTDNGVAIRRRLVSKHIFKNNQQVSIGRLWVDMETGVGLATGQGVNPQVIMRYSKDGGHTWSTELWATMGAIGKYLTRAIWQRLGRARDWVFELVITDPVKVVIINAGLRLTEGRE